MKNNGVLPFQELMNLVRGGGFLVKEHLINPASIDLSVGSIFYRAQSTALPSPGESMGCLLDRANAIRHEELLLQPGQIYFVRLNESVEKLPDTLYGRCNPKSTTGRLDIHVRVIAEGVSEYDVIPRGYAGNLYALIIPRSFPVILSAGQPIAQVRFFEGHSKLAQRDLLDTHAVTPLIYRSHEPIHKAKLMLQDDSVVLTLSMREGVVGYLAKNDVTEPIDLSGRGYDWRKYFEPIRSNGHRITLLKDRFYILNTAESFRVPPWLAAEFQPIPSGFLEARVHYAGFFDPGWGWGTEGDGKGATAVLEVRPFDNIDIVAGQGVATAHFERMTSIPTIHYAATGTYNSQDDGRPRLAKQFKMPE